MSKNDFNSESHVRTPYILLTHFLTIVISEGIDFEDIFCKGNPPRSSFVNAF